jgi:hypothetical protein
MGIPKSQSKMYPVAPACLILFGKRISGNPPSGIDSRFRCAVRVRGRRN